MSKLIFVIDDEEPIRRLLQRVLERAGFAVLTFADGRHALKQLEEKSPDLILLDIRMPGFSGIEFLNDPRRDRHKGPIFMLTSIVDPGEIASALSKGATAHLEKPFDIGSLISSIQDFFKVVRT